MALGDAAGGLGSFGGGTAAAGIFGAVGLATEIYGGLQESRIQKQEAGVSEEIAGYEEQINSQRQQLATDIYQRQTVQNQRQAAMAASRARAAGVNQGAQFSSGSIAGTQHAGAEEAFNQVGLNQNYDIGQNIFGLTGKIDAAQVQLASLGGAAATASGISSLGAGLMGSAMPAFNIFGGGGAQR